MAKATKPLAIALAIASRRRQRAKPARKGRKEESTDRFGEARFAARRKSFMFAVASVRLLLPHCIVTFAKPWADPWPRHLLQRHQFPELDD
jgi:hypothetical protein